MTLGLIERKGRMNYQEILAEFEAHVQSLSKRKKLEAGIAICKSLFFDYQRFFETYGWGNPDVLLDAIHICEQSLVGQTDISIVTHLVEKVDGITPDIDDFGEYLGSFALNASLVVHEILHFTLDGQVSHINDSAGLYLDTIDFRIHEALDAQGCDTNDHPLMVQARDFLLQIIR
jgi:uncharacterized protein YjaG (DUF416 family)